MKKRIIILLMACFFAALTGTSVMAGDASSVEITVDGEVLTTDVPAFIQDDRTLVPFRAIFEALGAEVQWDEDARIASGVKGDITIELPIDSTEAKVNGEIKNLDVPATIVTERTFVPLRFVGENFGCAVEWDGEQYLATITSSVPDDPEASAGPEQSTEPGPTEETSDMKATDIVTAAIKAYAPVKVEMDFSGSIETTSFGVVDFTAQAAGEMDEAQATTLTITADLGLVGKTNPTVELMPFSEFLVGPEADAGVLLASAAVTEDDSCYLVSLTDANCPPSLNALLDACSDDPHVVFTVTTSYVAHFDKTTGQLVEVSNISASGTGAVLGLDWPVTIEGSIKYTY